MKLKRNTTVIELGSLLSTVMDQARWKGEDEFPSSQLWADEIEKILNFALSQGVFEIYLCEQIASRNQRDSALAELRIAFYFHRNHFKILHWKPIGFQSKEGEYLVRGPSGMETFVEVKSPGWEGELSDEERSMGRTKQPKHITGQGRAVAPWERIQFAVDKAYSKFCPNISNLLVIADDLFVSVKHNTRWNALMALYSSHSNGRFTTPPHEKLGGVGLFWVENDGREIWYEMKLFVNSHALLTPLPYDLQQAFQGDILAPRQSNGVAL